MKVKELFECDEFASHYITVVGAEEIGKGRFKKDLSLIFDEYEDMKTVSDEFLDVVNNLDVIGFIKEVDTAPDGRPITEVIVRMKTAQRCGCEECEVSK